jgi:Na+/proline symporter
MTSLALLAAEAAPATAPAAGQSSSDILGLHYAIWIIVVLYFAGMLMLGWWSKREAVGREGFLLGKRQFGVGMMIMHAFGAGTHPGDVAGVMSKTVSSGASGIWVSWMWMFGTPFYWLIAPVVRRMRYLTLADYFEERFGKKATILYIIVATIGMIICTASVLLATTRTVQGMMGKAAIGAEAAAANEAWFFGILILTTGVFMIYSYWGGIVAAIRTDFVQGLMIIALSFIAIPAALYLPEVGGWSGALETLRGLDARGGSYLSLFDPKAFSWATVILLCINAPFSMLAQPHLITVCGAGKSEWEGRVGFCYGNILKRVCTMGWCILALVWLAYLTNTGGNVQPDAAFGDSVRTLLNPVLQGIMLACVLAAGMSTGSAIQVTVAGLFSQNFYRPYIRPNASDTHYVKVTKYAGIVIILASLAFAVPMRESVVETILDYFNLTACVGVAVGMGILWRRMNSGGFFTSAIAACAVFVVARTAAIVDGTLHVFRIKDLSDGIALWSVSKPCTEVLTEFGLLAGQAASMTCTRMLTIGLPLAVGFLGGVIGSLLTKPPSREAIEGFFKKIYVPVGQDHLLDRPLDEVVPPSRRLLTLGGLFIVKPSTQSWVGFLLALVLALGLVGLMVLLISL